MTTNRRHEDADMLRDSELDQLAEASLAALDARLVREIGRDTWFVVNSSDGPMHDIGVGLADGGGVRRVLVNGEPAEFDETEAHVIAHAPQPLRPGQGTIVVVHYR